MYVLCYSTMPFQADVYINFANPVLDLTNSGLDAGGQELRTACNEHIRQHGRIPSWGTATTTGGNLICQHVIHAVIGDCLESLEDSKQVLCKFITEVY